MNWNRAATITVSVLLAGWLALSIRGAPLGARNKSATQPATSQAQRAGEQMVFDFETADEVAKWSALDDPKAKVKEPAAKVEFSSEGATSGKGAMKITFDGGLWPAVATAVLPEVNWSGASVMLADVTVPRACVLEWRVYTDKSVRGYDRIVDCASRWDKTVFLSAGRNALAIAFAIPAKYPGKPVALEVAMYQPRQGESVLVDNIRLGNGQWQVAPKIQFSVLGTDLKVAGPDALGALLAYKWTKPVQRTLDQVEGDFKARFDEWKKSHPQAVLAVLRDGEKGFDPEHLDKVCDAWRDTFIWSHPPDGQVYNNAFNYGKAEALASFQRHRSRLMRVDVSSIPAGSEIVAAQMVLKRNPHIGEGRDPAKVPNVWVAEACNRAWDEGEVNAYQYAKDKPWKEVAGRNWTGDDPDFLPIYLAYGPSQGLVNWWDFTEAVKYWTDGKHANHGFFWHSDKDSWSESPSRRAREINDRPALMVIYEPRK